MGREASAMRGKNNETGYTMIETIMYISILGVLGVVLASYANAVFTRYKTGRIAQQILDLKKAILSYTAAEEDYSTLDKTKMQKDKAIPLDMRDLHHALGGSIELGPVGNSTTSKYLYYITFSGIYQKGCIELLSQGQFYGDGSEMDTLIVNDRTAWYYDGSFYDSSDIPTRHRMQSASNPAISVRPTMEQITNACNRKDDNSITWIFS